MTDSPFIALAENASLLLAIAFVYGLFAERVALLSTLVGRKVVLGVAVGALGIAVMTISWQYNTGVEFDSRSVLLGITGLFLGLVPTAIAMAMTAAFRLVQGGVGAWTGVAVIVISGAFGLAWRFRREEIEDITFLELYVFGFVIHGAMLAVMLSLPEDLVSKTLSAVALPVFLIYPLATALLGAQLASWLRRERLVAQLANSRRDLAESEALYRGVFEELNEGVAYCRLVRENGAPRDVQYLRVNNAFERMRGLSQIEGQMASEALPRTHGLDPELLSAYGRVADTGNSEVFENHNERLGKWFQVSVFSPRKGYFVSAFTDITEIKRVAIDNQAQLAELKSWQAVTLGREDRVVELKAEVNELLQSLGKPRRYGEVLPSAEK